jgi:DNA-directed RNA polymerase, subunit RPC10 (contains C4-type Zn-finger)
MFYVQTKFIKFNFDFLIITKVTHLSYYCSHCKREIDIDYENAGVRCLYCGHRILVKKRPATIKRIKAE